MTNSRLLSARAYRVMLFSLGIAFGLAPASAFPNDELTGDMIMRRVNARPQGQSCKMTMRLTLKDLRRGDEVRQVKYRRQFVGDSVRSVYTLTAPEHMKGTRLTIVEKNDLAEMEMFFPSTGRIVPVVTRSLHALGTDFRCEDLRYEIPVGDFQFKSLGAVSLNGQRCLKVEMTPRRENPIQSKLLTSELGFTRSIGWVREECWIIVRAEFYSDSDKLLKTYQVDSLEKFDEYWTVVDATMTNHSNQHCTRMQASEVSYELARPDPQQ